MEKYTKSSYQYFKGTTSTSSKPVEEYSTENNAIKEEEYIEKNNMENTNSEHCNCLCNQHYEGRYGNHKRNVKKINYNNFNPKNFGTISNYKRTYKPSNNNVFHEIKNCKEGKNYKRNIYNTEQKKDKVQIRNNYYNSTIDNQHYDYYDAMYHNTNYYDKNSYYKSENISSLNPRKIEYYEDYDDNNYDYDYYNNSTYQKSNIKYETYREGRIENFYDNSISKDGQYLVTISISKIVNDPIQKINKENNTKIIESKSNNYKKEVITKSRNQIRAPKKIVIKNTTKKKKENINDKYGLNYQYFERKENKSKQKNPETHHEARESFKVRIRPGKEAKTFVKRNYAKVIENNNTIN